MRDISDEMLMAYVDGELGEEDRRSVEMHIGEHPGAASRLAVFQSTGRVLGELFGAPIQDAVPQRLYDAATGVPGATMGNVVSIEKLRAARTPKLAMLWATAAALVAVVAAGTATRFWEKTGGTVNTAFDIAAFVDQDAIARGGLEKALESVPSNTETALTIDAVRAAFKPVFTFASAAGGYCRQYELSSERDVRLAGVACRRDDGAWHVELHAPIAMGAATEGKIAPAGGKSSEKIDNLVDKLISGDVLGPDQESKLLQEGWRRADR